MTPGQPNESDQGEDATRLLLAASSGDPSAADQLLPLVYAQLKRTAQRDLAGERAGHTLSATALVHEAYLKLLGPRELPWANRGHFYAAAAEAMRRLLLDHARARRGPRGKALALGEIADVAALAGAGAEEIVAVDEAVARLEAEDPQAGALVRLRFYAGLGVDEAAASLGISPRSAARLWTYARAVLYRDLHPETDP